MKKLHVAGDVTVPGDKSITHRALMFAAAARGTSRLRGLQTGSDARSTAGVLRALGCEVGPLDAGGEVRVSGGGLRAWRTPAAGLDCGNSGTTARLMLGWLAAVPHLDAVLDGDESLRSRPMRRVTEPLRRMGARFDELGPPDRLPVRVRGGTLAAIDYASPVASAQVKSAILLAAAAAGVGARVTEPLGSRDHTERLLRALCADVRVTRRAGAVRTTLAAAPVRFQPLDLDVPGDPSAAAFLAALAWLAGSGELRIRGVCANPGRTGFYRTARRMGARLRWEARRVVGGEPVADLLLLPSALRSATVAPAEVPDAIDEIPILAALAARAAGETRVTGAGELRAKESDRIRAIVENLRSVGVSAEELPDGFVVVGSDRALAGTVRTHGDHRIAMAFGVLAALPGGEGIRIDHPEAADVSYPGFWDALRTLTAA